ncbi:MAG: hypothetical protein AB1349_13890, partial [Elusimicrobiota bacterium]
MKIEKVKIISVFLIATIFYLLCLNYNYVGYFSDDATYILIAKKIFSQPYAQYPPLFPFFISIFLKIFGSNLLLLKSISMFAVLLSGLLIHSYWKTTKTDLIFLVLFLFLFHPLTMVFSTSVMSESIYLLYTIIIFIYLDNFKIAENYLKPIFILAIVSIIPAYIRTIGFTVPASLLLYLILKRKFTSASCFALFVALFSLPLLIWWQPSSYYAELNKNFFAEFLSNISYYSTGIFNLFFLSTNEQPTLIKSFSGFFISVLLIVG